MKKKKWGKYKMTYKTNRKLKEIALANKMNIEEMASVIIKHALRKV